VRPKQLYKTLRFAIENKFPVLIKGSPGCGKCLGKDTPILMYDGTIKKSQDICRGELLMGPDSKRKMVLSINIGHGNLFKIIPIKGDSFVCNRDHVLSLSSGCKKWKKRYGDVINMSLDDYLSRTKHFHQKSKLWRTGVEFGGSKTLPFDPYLIGLWIGDGDRCGARIAMGSVKKEAVIYLKKWAAENEYRLIENKSAKSDCSSYRITKQALRGKRNNGKYSNPLRQYMLNQCSTKHKERNIPLEYLTADRPSMLQLLAGIIDTDGSLHGNCYEITQKDLNVVNQIVFLARSLGLAAYYHKTINSIKSRKFTGTYFRILISGNTNIIPCKIPHKKATERRQIKNALFTGFSVESIGRGHYYGFTLDGDGLFLLGDFTVTHNSDIVAQACKSIDAKLITSHPVVSDPTDYKGLPFPTKDGTEATFLPFGDLLRLIRAKKPTVFFLDDLGQAPSSVQAAVMNLLLARKINGHKVADCVTFLAATNRRQDKAAVQGILEPVKSRFAAIVELEINIDDWVEWAIKNDMPTELIAFIRFRPDLLNKFKPTADIVNTPNPRTVAFVGSMVNKGIPDDCEYEIISGATGEGFAAEFTGFRQVWKDLPDLDKLIADPKGTKVPSDPAILYATCGALAAKANRKNFKAITEYTNRLPGELQVLLIRDAIQRTKSLSNTSVFSAWAIAHSDVII